MPQRFGLLRELAGSIQHLTRRIAGIASGVADALDVAGNFVRARGGLAGIAGDLAA